jgi:hypothetical protein
MKFAKIVGFGDSWMWGDELLDPALVNHPNAHPVLMENTEYRESHCFLGLLGQHYGVPTENFGIAGGSLQSTIWNYLWWLQHEPNPKDCLVLIALTTANRHSFYNPGHHIYANDPPWHRYVHSAWVNSGAGNIKSEWVDMVKKHMVLTDCEKLFNLNYEQTVLFFDGQIQDTAGVLQFNSMMPQKRMQRSSLLWPDLGLQVMFSKLPHRRHLLAPGGHPNVAGHDWIAELLIPEIDRAILAE